MSSVTKVPTGWRARYRTPEGASRSKTFARKIDAEQFLTSVEHSKLSGAYIDTSAGRITLSSYATSWLEGQVNRPLTMAGDEMNLRVHILPSLGHRQIGALRPSEIQAWVKGRSEVLAPSSVGNVYGLLVTILRAAVADRIITRSPADGVKLPRVPKTEVVPMTGEQVLAIAEAMPARFRTLVIAGAATGLRQGELLGLCLEQIDFLRRTIRVDRQLVTLSGQLPVSAPPKTAASVRTIVAPDVVLLALSAHK